MKSIPAIAIATLLSMPLFAQEEAWVVDKAHSTASFKVRHLMAMIPGTFRDFDAEVTLDRANPTKSSVELTIETKSIDTANANRDEHLRSPDFFDVKKHATLKFKSRSIKAVSKTEYEVTGDLTIRGVTKRVTVPVMFLGFGKDARGREKAGFEIETILNRKDYGILWNQQLDDGGSLLGDEVKISLGLQLVRK